MNIPDHTTKVFDLDLVALTQMIAQMGGLAQKQINDSIKALAKRDIELARQVIATDATVDDLQQTIEEKVVTTIALRQPVAIDLRTPVAMLRIVGNLERIGDLAKNVGKRVIAMIGKRPPCHTRPQAHDNTRCRAIGCGSRQLCRPRSEGPSTGM